MSLKIFSENKAELLELHEKTQEDIDQDVNILKEWIKQQPHLPEALLEDDKFLEVSLIKNKYSIEKTKQKLENYCTLKGKYSYLLENLIGTIKPREEAVFYHYIEQLTEKKLHRIVVMKVADEERYDGAREAGIGLIQRELLSRYDYNDGEIIICDYTDCSAQFATKWRLNVLVNALEMIMKGHSTKMKEIHMINKWASIFISFCKPFLPEKLRSRIYGHATIDTVKDIIPKKYLPKDYGGEQKSLREIQDDWEKIYKENREMLQNAYDLISREELRLEPTTQELQGTFKQLAVD